MSWVAIVPVNYGRECKTRLAARLTRARRTDLVACMARHVLQQLFAVPAIGTVRVISAIRPDFAADLWIADQGRGLNDELEAARASFAQAHVVFIHGDLPFLTVDDLTALLGGAQRHGAAIAPDRHGLGTNALAIADDRAFSPAFGANSFSRHRALLPDAAIVSTPGLSFDLDDPEDLDIALARGLVIA